jgi:hypothetical protein
LTQELTYEDVQHFLNQTAFDFLPSQGYLSFPIIQRIHRRLQNGHRFDPIKVTSNGLISDGHHRYVCLIILGITIDSSKAGKNHNQLTYHWNKINLERKDYDSLEKIKKFELLYD